MFGMGRRSERPTSGRRRFVLVLKIGIQLIKHFGHFVIKMLTGQLRTAKGTPERYLVRQGRRVAHLSESLLHTNPVPWGRRGGIAPDLKILELKELRDLWLQDDAPISADVRCLVLENWTSRGFLSCALDSRCAQSYIVGSIADVSHQSEVVQNRKMQHNFEQVQIVERHWWYLTLRSNTNRQ